MLQFIVPRHEKNFGASEFLQPGFSQMILANSTENPLCRIEYSLEVYIKHDSKLEFGSGNSVSFNF